MILIFVLAFKIKYEQKSQTQYRALVLPRSMEYNHYDDREAQMGRVSQIRSKALGLRSFHLL